MLRRSRTLNDEQEFFEVLQKKRQLFEGSKSQRSQDNEPPNWKTGNKPQKPIEFGVVYTLKKAKDSNAPAEQSGKPTVHRAYRPHQRGHLVRSQTLPEAPERDENTPGAALVMAEPPAFYKQRYGFSQHPGEPPGPPPQQHRPPPLSQRQGYTRSKTAPVAAAPPVPARPTSAHSQDYNGYPMEMAPGRHQVQRSYTPGGSSYTPGAGDQQASNNYNNYPRLFNPPGFQGSISQDQAQPSVSSVNQPAPRKAGHVISAHKPRKVKAYGGRAKSMDSALFEEVMAKKREAELAQQNQAREAEYTGAVTVLENQIRQLQQQEEDKIEAYKQLWRQELATGSVSRYMPGAGSYVTTHYVAPPPPGFKPQVQTFYETKKKKVPTATLR